LDYSKEKTICHICAGSGEVTYNTGTFDDSKWEIKTCQGCHGSGLHRIESKISILNDYKFAMEEALIAFEGR